MFKMFDSLDVLCMSTPSDLFIIPKQNRDSSVSENEYAKIIESVMFMMSYTRIDITYNVSRLTHYTLIFCTDH